MDFAYDQETDTIDSVKLQNRLERAKDRYKESYKNGVNTGNLNDQKNGGTVSSVLTKNTGHARNGQPVFCLFASFGFLYGEQGCERKRDQSDSPDDPHQGIRQSEIKER